MKKFLIKIILFFLIVAGVDFCFGLTCDQMNVYAKGGETKQLYDLIERSFYDVLILGSSRAHHHYVPEIIDSVLGKESYNAGYDGNGVILAYPILAHVTERHKPDIVIFEISRGFDITVNAEDKNNTRYISRLKPFYRIPQVAEAIKAVSLDDYVQVHSGFYRYNSNFIHMLMDNLLPMKMDPMGYQALSGTYAKDKMRLPYNKKSVDSLKIHYLKELAAFGEQNRMKMVWILSPQFYEEVEEHKDYDIAKRIAAKYNIPFLDYYVDSSFVGHRELFRDATHMNDKGARLYSEKVAEDIKDLFNI